MSTTTKKDSLGSVGVPLERYFRLFLADKKAEAKSDNYITWLDHRFTPFVRWFNRTYQRAPLLKDFSTQCVREFILSEKERKRWPDHPIHKGDNGVISDTTLKHEVRALKIFGSWLNKEEYTKEDLLAKVKVPKIQEYELDPLSPDEEKVIIQACDDRTHVGARRLAIVLLMLDTGVRRQELVDLETTELHLDDGYVTVIGKGKKQRSIPFGRKTERALRRYSELRDPATIQADRYFFLDEDGYQMTANAVKMIFQRLRKRIGILRLHPHLLRHTYGIRNIEGGVSTLVLQSRMGHSSPQVTEMYAHASQSEKVKRDRSFSHVDLLDVRIRKPRQDNRKSLRK